MKSQLISLGILMFLICTGAPVFAQSAEDENWDRYQVVFERSVFSRNRTRKVTPPPRVEQATVVQDDVEPTPPPPPPEPPHPATHFVLIGISQVDGEGTAIFEDRRDSSIHDVVAGDELGELRIKSVDELAVLTTYEDKPVKVSLGRTLTGEVAPSVVRSSATSAESTSADESTSGGPAASGSSEGGSESADPGTLSIIERMRLRRQQELGR